jgi:2,4-dienoyl-CoA reductase-like NADH-dependent reductase (Old Yellow Enzyme family)
MTLVPSQVKGLSSSSCKEVTVEDIQEIVNAFGHAATRAKEGGFDGVQIHAAHGYLLSEFLSPAFNKRTDEYGGSVENRARALREVLKSIRDAVGDDFPVLVKLNCQDFIKGGLTLRDSLKVGAFLQEGRIDAIELSGGMRLSGNLSQYRLKIISEEKEAYFRHEAKAFKEKLHVPLILVGGIRTFQLAERLVEDGYADYISMSRPFIREPSLVKRWESGDLRKATCVSDNRCFEPIRAGEGIYCVVEKKQKERKKVL